MRGRETEKDWVRGAELASFASLLTFTRAGPLTFTVLYSLCRPDLCPNSDVGPQYFYRDGADVRKRGQAHANQCPGDDSIQWLVASRYVKLRAPERIRRVQRLVKMPISGGFIIT